jgi:hypothetical protein
MTDGAGGERAQGALIRAFLDARDSGEAGLTAHLWRLTTAWECLDVVAVQRQLRALDALAAESGAPRIAFFAASRRAMHAALRREAPEFAGYGASQGVPSVSAEAAVLDTGGAPRASA